MNITTAERVKRLQLLRRRLKSFRATKGRRFHMPVWGLHVGTTHPVREQNYCGTAACALGWAALMPQFRKLGLKMHWSKRDYGWEGLPTLRLDQPNVWGDIVITGEDAGQILFGLTDAESTWLFLRMGSRESVIKRIDKLIAHDGRLNE